VQPDNVMFREGDKFMWDGELYETHEAAEAKRKEYADHDFETQLVEGEGEFLVYSRRVVTEIVLEGEAPLG
jgi:hypothetical protein